jgi:hypothetical protein
MRDRDWYNKWADRFFFLSAAIFASGALLNLIMMILSLTR